MTNVIHLSKHAAAAPPNLDQLLETRVLLAQGTQSLCDTQIWLGGPSETPAASEQRDCREMETNRKRA